MHYITGNPVLDGVGQPVMIEVDEEGNEVPGAGKTEEEKKVRGVLLLIVSPLCSCVGCDALVLRRERCLLGFRALRAVYA
jgi:hypothetical protein